VPFVCPGSRVLASSLLLRLASRSAFLGLCISARFRRGEDIFPCRPIEIGVCSDNSELFRRVPRFRSTSATSRSISALWPLRAPNRSVEGCGDARTSSKLSITHVLLACNPSILLSKSDGASYLSAKNKRFILCKQCSACLKTDLRLSRSLRH